MEYHLTDKGRDGEISTYLRKKVSGLCLLTESPVGPLNPCRFMMRTVNLLNTTRSAPGPQNKETKIKKPRTRRGSIRIFGRDNVR